MVWICIWIAGWIAATIFTAAVIGNTDNVRGSGRKDFPTFIVPLIFGWSWPVVVTLAAIICPLAILSDRATSRSRPDA